MRSIIWILSLATFTVYGQVNSQFSASQFYINQNGDSLYFPEPDSLGKKSKFYFYDNNSQIQEIRLLNNDTLLNIFSANNQRFHHYYKVRKAVGNETYNKFPLLLIRDGIGLGSRDNEYLLFVKGYSFYDNGKLKTEMIINSNTYKTYSSNGSLESKSDSCNNRLLPTGIYTKYDTITGEVIAEGNMKQCSFNSFMSCEDGWWKFYSEGNLTSKKLYKDGRLIEE